MTPRLVVLACGIGLIATANAVAQTGVTYRFKADTLTGRVWVLGDNARRELETGENGLAAGRVEIWKDRGRQVLVLNPRDRTYYDDSAWRAKRGIAPVSAALLTVREPFRVEAVKNVQVTLDTRYGVETVNGVSCRRSVLTFSYELDLALTDAAATRMPARVEGSQDACLVDTQAPVRLPFDHALEVKTGHSEVDVAIAARLVSLQGIPAARLLKVTRRIDKGETVSAVSPLMVTEIQPASIPADRFDVPKDYRYREPDVVPPARK
jgi:hypothetical protein